MRTAFALIALLAWFTAGCTAPAPGPETLVDAAPPAATAPATASPTPGASTPTPVAPPQAMEAAPAQDPANPSRSCKVDSDCAVKDVGNCCGYFPACVNKDAKTDPAAVRAQCERNDMSSICGFQEVQGCRCVQGRCENLATPGPAVM